MTTTLFRRLASSVGYRLKRRRFGLSKASDLPESLGARIDGKCVKLVFPKAEREIFTHEFCKILLDDCYGLEQIGQSIGTVLDVGANLGLFSLAARHHFPNAAIHAYEPNNQLEPYLQSNLKPFQIEVHMVALGAFDGHVSLIQKENSLHTVSVNDSNGDVTQTTFKTAISRLGGRVDLLKLDCEGAEWALFESPDLWPNIGSVTMEYHLWAKPQSKLDDLTAVLRHVGFKNIKTFPSADGTFGLLWASRP